MKTIRVIAVAGRRLPFEGAVGRFVGRDKRNAVSPDGDEVPAAPYYQRAITRGDLAVETDAQRDERGKRAKDRDDRARERETEAAKRAKEHAAKRAEEMAAATEEQAKAAADSEPSAAGEEAAS